MKWVKFHHPDWCPTVLRRRTTEEALHLAGMAMEAVFTRGHSLLWGSCFPSQTAYRAAVCRLQKQGLIAYRRTGGRLPQMLLTDAGEKRLPPAFRRRPPWPAKWNGIWNLLVYDVPENHRPYRDVLRAFLRQMRMGCLQKSVWVSPRDIRPEFADLTQAGAADNFAFLFESRTVLGRSPQDVVETAWPMRTLRERHRWFLELGQENLRLLDQGGLTQEDLCALAHEERTAYGTVMEDDPFLPRALLPQDYLGEQVWNFHRKFCRQITSAL